MKQEPRVGVGAMIFNEQGELLLILRKKSPDAGHWSLPGGKVDLYETIEAATIREIKEEINLEIELSELVCVTNHILVPEETHFVCPTFKARIVGGTLHNNEPDKLGGVAWFSLTDLPSPLTFTTTNAIKYLS